MHGVELNSVRGPEFCETLTGGFTREFPGGRTRRRVKLQRSGTPRAVEFPEEWNSQESGTPRGMELPGGGTLREVELSGGGTLKSKISTAGAPPPEDSSARAKFQLLESPSERIRTAGEPLSPNSTCGGVSGLEDSSANSIIDIHGYRWYTIFLYHLLSQCNILHITS